MAKEKKATYHEVDLMSLIAMGMYTPPPDNKRIRSDIDIRQGQSRASTNATRSVQYGRMLERNGGVMPVMPTEHGEVRIVDGKVVRCVHLDS